VTTVRRAFAWALALTLSACGPLVTIGTTGGRPAGPLELDEARSRCDAKEACACGAMGRFFVDQDKPAQAETYFARGCDRGCAEACADLSDLHLASSPPRVEHGIVRGVAACWIDPRFCEPLAARFSEGRGVPKDESEARRLRKRACSHGIEEACAR
jgi:hypothetical protein